MTAATLPFVATLRPPAPRPHPKPLDTLGFFRALTDNPLTIWTEDHYREPYVRMPAGIVPERLLVNDPDGIRHVLVDYEPNFQRDDLQNRVLRRTIGLGLFAAEGAAWRAQRKAVAPLFTPRAVASFLPAMAAAAEAGAGRLDRLPEGAIVDVAQEMSAVALDVLERTLFKEGFGTDLDQVSAHSKAFVDGAGGVTILDLLHAPTWIPGLRYWRVRRSRRFLEHMVERMVVARRARLAASPGAEDEVRDIITLLVDCAARENLSEQEVRDNVMTFIGAGHETTSYALSWTLFLLSQDQSVRAAVEAEIDRVAADGPIGPDRIGDLVLVRAVIEEAMRLYPTAPFMSRVAVADDVIGGHEVKAGTLILIVPWLIHRHRRLWAEPDLFDPGRFLPGRRETIPRYAYLPFGAGPRVCIGSAFAMQEAVLVLARVLRERRFDLVDGHPIEPVQRITLRPRGGMPMRVTRR